jgi:hypothetical protein
MSEWLACHLCASLTITDRPRADNGERNSTSDENPTRGMARKAQARCSDDTRFYADVVAQKSEIADRSGSQFTAYSRQLLRMCRVGYAA